MLKKILPYLPPFLAERVKQFSIARYRRKIAGKTAEEVFEFIYRAGIWGTREVKSGGGSTEDQTRELVEQLPLLLEKYGIKTLLDIPCGDFSWMCRVDLQGIDYTGGDIVEKIVAENQKKYSAPNRRFLKMNILEDPLPAVALILCRDCFVHFPISLIIQSLDNIRKSGSRYLLVTSFPETTLNEDIQMGEWRRLNMEREPFNLKPIAMIDEKCTEGNGRFRDKSLLLIDLLQPSEK
ncbi:MAG: class I SAM-dependent methyltransferase [Bacteroidia bacterium]|nr:class I SAM-dependent methyltransferase [Bacteroidia bacterium]